MRFERAPSATKLDVKPCEFVVHNALNVKPCEFNYKLEVNYMKEEGD
jgi:hypothetical protein